MVVYTDNAPLNADIDVDFQKKKVNFSYPYNSKNQKIRVYFIYLVVVQATLVLGFPIWMIMLLGSSLVSTFAPTQYIRVLVTLFLIISYTLMWFIVPYLVAIYINKNYGKYSKKFPAFSAWFFGLISKKETIIFRNIKSKSVEIPFFRNILLEYDARGNYGSELLKIEIKALPFERIKRKKIIPNYFKFKCIFKFKKVPKTGYLIVKYI